MIARYLNGARGLLAERKRHYLGVEGLQMPWPRGKKDIVHLGFIQNILIPTAPKHMYPFIIK